MIISPIDNLLTVARAAADYDAKPTGTHRARLQLALSNLKAIPGTGTGPERAAVALRDLSAQLNRLALTIGYPGPQWDPVGFPDLAAALVGYEARCKLASPLLPVANLVMDDILTQALEQVDGCMDVTQVEPDDAAAWQIIRKLVVPS